MQASTIVATRQDNEDNPLANIFSGETPKGCNFYLTHLHRPVNIDPGSFSSITLNLACLPGIGIIFASCFTWNTMKLLKEDYPEFTETPNEEDLVSAWIHRDIRKMELDRSSDNNKDILLDQLVGSWLDRDVEKISKILGQNWKGHPQF